MKTSLLPGPQSGVFFVESRPVVPTGFAGQAHEPAEVALPDLLGRLLVSLPEADHPLGDVVVSHGRDPLIYHPVVDVPPYYSRFFTARNRAQTTGISGRDIASRRLHPGVSGHRSLQAFRRGLPKKGAASLSGAAPAFRWRG